MFPVTIRTTRLVIRELDSSDADAVQRCAGDPEVVRHLPFGPNTPDQTRTFIERVLLAQRESPRRNYEMSICQNDELIGCVRLTVRSADDRQGDLGYMLRRDRWGNGFMTETTRAIVGFGFESLSLHRIWATCGTENAASVRVLEKVGMRREGHLLHERLVRGKWRDTYIYAVLEDDWRSGKPASSR
jgi:RimJ/RimL family protein N-acetyltransferase